jgi:hypothetical protein
MDPIQTLLLQANQKTNSFSATSRYKAIETAVLEKPGAQPIVFLKRRFVPSPESFFTLREHTVKQGERPDHIAHEHLGNPEQFWQVCDANQVMHPLELTEETGRTIRITLPQGIPGNSHV